MQRIRSIPNQIIGFPSEDLRDSMKAWEKLEIVVQPCPSGSR